MAQSVFITNFHKIVPPYKLCQQDVLNWITELHVDAETKCKGLSISETNSFREEMELFKSKVSVGLGPKNIRYRCTFVRDVAGTDDDRVVYNVHDNNGACSSTAVRSAEYLKITEDLFEKFYENVTDQPENIIHTSCTGNFLEFILCVLKF